MQFYSLQAQKSECECLPCFMVPRDKGWNKNPISSFGPLKGALSLIYILNKAAFSQSFIIVIPSSTYSSLIIFQ
jgi:hypothetical protein